jgi:hypothetical protein
LRSYRYTFVRRYILPTTGRYSIQLRPLPEDLTVRRYTLGVSRDEDRGPTDLGVLGSVLLGQRVTYHYAGTAGERLNRFAVDRVVAPDGSTVADNGVRSAQVTLPVTGDYRIETTASGAALSNDLPPIAATVGTTALPELVRGQHVDLRYSGTAGEALGVGITTTASAVELRLPDDSPFPTTPGTRVPRFVLPEDGEYTVNVTAGWSPNPLGAAVVLSHDLDLGLRGEGSWPAVGRLHGQSFTVTTAAGAGTPFRLRTLDPAGTKPRLRVTAPGGSVVAGVPDPWTPGVSDPWTTYTPTETGAHQILVTPTSASDGGLITLEIDVLP